MTKTLVVHSTEGHSILSAVSTMDANRSWSNWVCDPRPGVNRLRTLVDGERQDRSLKNLPGGVETNNRPGVWQLEIVGFAKLIPGYEDVWYRNLARMVIEICDAKGIPKRFPHRFVPYPASYGFKAAQRMSPAEWLACDGIVGHQHVPENDHGDPGDLNRLIPLVQGGPMPADRTAQISEWQRTLLGHGANLGTTGPNNDGVDGDFGPLTLTASKTVLSILTDQVAHWSSEAERLQGELDDLEAGKLSTEDARLVENLAAFIRHTMSEAT